MIVTSTLGKLLVPITFFSLIGATALIENKVMKDLIQFSLVYLFVKYVTVK